MEKYVCKRKFLLVALPLNINRYTSDEIQLGYSKKDLKIISYNNQEFFLENTKQSSKLEKLNSKRFSKLCAKFDIDFISKRRYYIPLTSKLTAEIDLYEEQIDDSFIVEVGFNSIKEAGEFELPFWFGPEVTNDPDYDEKILYNKITENVKQKKKA